MLLPSQQEAALLGQGESVLVLRERQGSALTWGRAFVLAVDAVQTGDNQDGLVRRWEYSRG